MTKKHFISLADSIRIYNRFASEPFTERQISELADFCKEQNGNFNRERWLGYIAGENGSNGGTIKPKTRPVHRVIVDGNAMVSGPGHLTEAESKEWVKTYRKINPELPEGAIYTENIER